MSSTREVAIKAVDDWRSSWRGASDCCYGANRLGLIDAIDTLLRQREIEVRAEERERCAKIADRLAEAKVSAAYTMGFPVEGGDKGIEMDRSVGGRDRARHDEFCQRARSLYEKLQIK